VVRCGVHKNEHQDLDVVVIAVEEEGGGEA
jgi:hypothetical protein